MVHWQYLCDAFTRKPDWKSEGGIWAPCINYIDNKYYLYYSYSKWGDSNPGIGLAISDHPYGPFADQGKVFDAASIGVENSIDPFYMRVFLSSVVWNDDAAGFKKRINTFLEICQRHKIKPMFVFFDDCWNQETPKGKQPAPRPGVHNSGWVQDPACSLRADTAALFPALEKYVKDIVGTFKNDDRVLMWDLYNEPGNSGHGIASVPLLKKVFQWARAEHPSQPLTSGIWFFEYPELNAFQLQNSDVITYHNYNDESNHKIWIGFLESYSRPMRHWLRWLILKQVRFWLSPKH